MKAPNLNTVRLKSTALQGYAGRLIYAGQIFDAREVDVAHLIADGLAKLIDPPPEQRPRRRTQTKKPASRSRRTYRRRDMEAETE